MSEHDLAPLKAAEDAYYSGSADDAFERAVDAAVAEALKTKADEIGVYEQMLRDAVEPFLDWLEQREAGAHIQDVRDGLIGVEDVLPDSLVVLGAHLRSDKDDGVLTMGHFRRLQSAYDGEAITPPNPSVKAATYDPHRYAVTSSDYSRPFLLGAYPTLEGALKAQNGKPDLWEIFIKLDTQSPPKPSSEPTP